MTTIRGRAELGQGGLTTVRFVITHPMLIERTDPRTGKGLPPHFIEEVTVTHKSEIVVSAAWGQAISQNPFFQFSLTGAQKGDSLTVAWRDNQGKGDSVQLAVT